MDMKSTIGLTIPADASYLDLVRLTLYGIATKAGFSYEEIEDMKVAVGEACNNAILHGYGNDAIGVVDIRFEREAEGLTIRIKDEGSSFQYDQASHREASLHDKKLSDATVGGLGLFMMQALMDDVQVHTDRGTEVVLTKMLSRKEEMA
ncbi:anti-sigma B factor RsbW [Paenibacillus sp. GCM10023252]|uniref:anti-sigma B factor RsbW n=1 Tax=Paenibacillus sp. GCM10023252 TaxID=3252649 RepID=UPI003612A221